MIGKKGPARIGHGRRWIIPLFLFIGVGLLLLLPLVRGIENHILAEDVFLPAGVSDAYNFLWTYWWIHKALALGQTIYQCTWILPPTGANLFFHTHVLLPTILTYPLGAVFGPVVGYNLMVFLLLVFSAWAQFVILRTVYDAPPVPAFIAGLAFGFAPYFIFKAHAHVNLIGAVFWETALGALYYAYLKKRFDLLTGTLFSVGLWATYWTSFVEFFMSVVTIGLSVVALEAYTAFRHQHVQAAAKVRFFLPALLGAMSLLSFRFAPDIAVLRGDPFPTPFAGDIFTPSPLSILSWRFRGPDAEIWGNCVPLTVCLLGCWGLAVSWRDRRWNLLPAFLLAVLVFMLTLDILGVPSTLFRLSLWGQGFRALSRFFPFFLFFLSPFFCLGVDRVVRGGEGKGRIILGFTLAILFVLEIVPFKLRPSEVRLLPGDTLEKVGLDRRRFLYVVPDFLGLNRTDLYQVGLDMPVVQISYLARTDSASQEIRLREYPHVYGRMAPDFSPAFYSDLRRLNVGYLLFESERSYTLARPPGRILHSGPGEIIVSLPWLDSVATEGERGDQRVPVGSGRH